MLPSFLCAHNHLLCRPEKLRPWWIRKDFSITVPQLRPCRVWWYIRHIYVSGLPKGGRGVGRNLEEKLTSCMKLGAPGIDVLLCVLGTHDKNFMDRFYIVWRYRAGSIQSRPFLEGAMKSGYFHTMDISVPFSHRLYFLWSCSLANMSLPWPVQWSFCC